ncbi:MAG: ATP-binding protein [Candidatus Rokubacteria bacterium]|nr:ATP-binding protein [Candidatus Rokubacteria bacterium]
MGETRVDLLHLLEDLRDAYPGSPEETILTEIVANSLDSRAATIAIRTDAAQRTLCLIDDGLGMRRRELARYHDIAATTKTRGEGIGFAGVGIKVALLLCREVLTEARQGKHHVATSWALVSRHRAPWRWIPPPGLVADRGTAVRLTLENALSPLLDPGFIETAVRRHFGPLLDPTFAQILAPQYPRGVRLVLNGDALGPEVRRTHEVAAVALRLARKRKPSAAGHMFRARLPLPEDQRGIAVSTFGKVIKRGWDWLGITPAAPDRIGGLVEAPGLAACLTLNKADFIRSGPRGATYLAYRKVLQEVVARQLASWGDAVDIAERERRRAARPVERDLETVLLDLADSFPLLAALVEQRAGGQRQLPVAPRGGDGTDLAPAALSWNAAPDASHVAGPPASPAAPVPAGLEAPPPTPDGAPPAPRVDSTVAEDRGPRRPRRYGLSIQFEARPHDPELGRLVESTVWVNEAHAAYRRAAASRSEGYHIALASALALAPLAVEPAKEHAFVTAFLASWGAALDRRRSGRRVPGRGSR